LIDTKHARVYTFRCAGFSRFDDMKKVGLLLITIIYFNCEKEIECITIQDKYGGNGTFYFEWDRTTQGNTDRQIGTGSVSERIYNQYEIGDVIVLKN
tara:strand:- start:354 stop:644 length:291 start_codon:yes stop_codon:yes gene_type:complete